MNNAIRVDNSFLREIALCCERNEFAFIPADEDLKGKHTFSDVHIRKMMQLADSVENRQKNSRRLKFVIVLAALIALIAAMAMGVGGVRDADYEMVINDYGHYINVTYRRKSNNIGEFIAPESMELIYEVPAPIGYKLVYCNINPLESHYVFETPGIFFDNGTGHTVSFSQGTLQGVFNINTENMERSVCEINGVTCVCLTGDYCYITWVEYGYVFSLLSDNIPRDRLIAIAERMYVNEEMTEFMASENKSYQMDENGITVTDWDTGEIIPYP